MSQLRRSAVCLAALLSLFAGALGARADVDQLQKSFNAPPDDCKIMTRYWWFGPAVTKTSIDRDLTAMKQGGFGGFEVNPVYPMAIDGQYPGLKNLKFLSPEYFDMLNYLGTKAKELGLRMNLTLGSGWPYGGPMFTATEGAGRIAASPSVRTTAGQTTVKATLGRGQTIAAALAWPASGTGEPTVLAIDSAAATATIPADLAKQACTVNFYLTGRVNMQVKRAAYGADGLVIDHLSPTVVDKFIAQIAGPEVNAVGNNPIASIFCDSLELSGENWTDSLLDEFQKRRGYDLRPLLPALFDNSNPKAADIRHDWGQTQTEMFNDNFVAKFAKFAADHNTKFRIQAYGGPAAAEFTYASCQLPEGEMGHQTTTGFNDCRYAASATHLLGIPVASSETYTWLKDTVFRATPLDMKSESNWQFLQGINQLICHGWPSTADNVPYPGWTFYVAAVFNEKNPWFIAMPDTTKYLQRVSFMMRAGQPASDVAFYLADSDAWAQSATTGSVTTPEAGTVNRSGAIAAILGAGYNVDFWDDGLLNARGQVADGALAFGNVHYRIVVIDGATRMPLATMNKLEEFVKGGGTLVCIGNPPSVVPGYKSTAADQQSLHAATARIFSGAGAQGISIANASQFGAAVAKHLRPDFAMTPAIPAIGFVHRHTDDGEIYFVANTSNQRQNTVANFRVETGNPEWWDPMTGKVSPAEVIERSDHGTAIALHLEPYGTRLLVFTGRTLPVVKPPVIADIPKPIDLSTNWTVTFGPTGKPTKMAQLTDWISSPATANFSGVATYQQTLNLPANMIRDGLALTLSLGPDNIAGAAPGGGRAGRGGGGGGGGGSSMAANLDPPVREVAVITVNGTRAGALWSPPYTLDITSLLKAGDNDIKIDVGNTAINYASANGMPDFTQAIRQFGNRATPPNLRGTALVSSGLFGPIQLIPAQAKP